MNDNQGHKETILTPQEMEDIKAVSNAIYMDGVFSGLPPERKTEMVCLAAVQADCLNLMDVPEKHLSDGLILNVLQKHGSLIFAVDKERRTQEMYMTALENDGTALLHFPKEMITPEIALKAVTKHGFALKSVPETIKTPEMCRIALNNTSDPDFKDDFVIENVPFPDVCLEHLKKYEKEGADPFMLFGCMNRKIITPEIAELAFRLDPGCFQLVPERLKTPEMCMDAVKKDWMNMRFIPEEMKTKELCDAAMKRSIHAQQLVPDKFKTPEMYMPNVKADGMNLEFVPEKYRTPEICLQAVKSNPDAVDFVPERFTGDYNIYEFYHGKLKDEFLLAGQLSFEQVQKVFQGETVYVNDMKFAKNVTLRDFTLDYDGKTNQLTVKALDEKPEKKQAEKKEEKPAKRKKVKI